MQRRYTGLRKSARAHRAFAGGGGCAFPLKRKRLKILGVEDILGRCAETIWGAQKRSIHKKFHLAGLQSCRMVRRAAPSIQGPRRYGERIRSGLVAYADLRKTIDSGKSARDPRNPLQLDAVEAGWSGVLSCCLSSLHRACPRHVQ